MKKVAIFFLLCACLLACKKDVSNSVSLGKDYYPLNLNHWITYNVDSITFSDFTNPVSIDTTHFQIREFIESSFEDLNLEENYRIEVAKRSDSTNWQINDVFTVKQTNFNLQKEENDLRFIKLVFPPKIDKTWNGNIFLDVIDEPTLEYLDADKYNWEYRYTAIDESIEIGEFQFDSCVTVIQIDEENLFEKKYSKEIYAKNVGLVYKELLILNTQAPPSSQSFLERAENGFILIYTINDYKR